MMMRGPRSSSMLWVLIPLGLQACQFHVSHIVTTFCVERQKRSGQQHAADRCASSCLLFFAHSTTVIPAVCALLHRAIWLSKGGVVVVFLHVALGHVGADFLMFVVVAWIMNSSPDLMHRYGCACIHVMDFVVWQVQKIQFEHGLAQGRCCARKVQVHPFEAGYSHCTQPALVW